MPRFLTKLCIGDLSLWLEGDALASGPSYKVNLD